MYLFEVRKKKNNEIINSDELEIETGEDLFDTVLAWEETLTSHQYLSVDRLMTKRVYDGKEKKYY